MNDIGLIGLAVMGQNLIRNIASKGYSAAVYNRTNSITTEFTKVYGSLGITGYETLNEFIKSIKAPRNILVMVKAGDPVDAVITQLLPLLDKNDTIIDCGNSYWKDTERRYSELKEKGINFIGTGVSGGEEGALKGPSIMPGISQENESYDETLLKVFQDISAKDFSGNSCVTKLGKGGAGHFVKMVHNGIEYSIMGMISEVFQILRERVGLDYNEIQTIFESWNKGKLNSYLVEITGKVLKQKDDLTSNSHLIDVIKDTAGAKGTGLWTSIDGLENQADVSSIISATFARVNSSKKDLRVKLSKLYSQHIFDDLTIRNTKEYLDYIDKLENALYLGVLLSYSQGLNLIRKVSSEKEWNINLAEVVRIWEGGCIIRADLLEDLMFELQDIKVEDILELTLIRKEVDETLGDLVEVINGANNYRLPTPVLSSSLQYFYSMTQEQSNANMIQILRDHFGAHTYERIDREGTFHTTWKF